MSSQLKLWAFRKSHDLVCVAQTKPYEFVQGKLLLILVQDVVTFILYLVTTWKLSVIWLSAFFFPFWKQEFQKTLGGKQPVYDTTIRTGRALKEKTLLPDDTQKLDNLLGEVRDKWDTVCGKSVERWAWMSPSWVSVLSQK